MMKSCLEISASPSNAMPKPWLAPLVNTLPNLVNKMRPPNKTPNRKEAKPTMRKIGQTPPRSKETEAAPKMVTEVAPKEVTVAAPKEVKEVAIQSRVAARETAEMEMTRRSKISRTKINNKRRMRTKKLRSRRRVHRKSNRPMRRMRASR